MYYIESWDDVSEWEHISTTSDLKEAKATLQYIKKEVDTKSEWRIKSDRGGVVFQTNTNPPLKEAVHREAMQSDQKVVYTTETRPRLVKLEGDLHYEPQLGSKRTWL